MLRAVHKIIAACFSLTCLWYLSAHLNEQGEKPKQLRSSILKSDCHWLIKFEELYEEIGWHADGLLVSPEGLQEQRLEQSPSKLIHSAYYPEFDRSAMSIKAMQTWLDGNYTDYLEFVKAQKKEERLTYTTFKKICKEINCLISDINGYEKEDIKQALYSAIVYKDLGKTCIAKNKGEELGVPINDHHLFLYEAMKKDPTIFPSFSKLSSPVQDLLLKLTTMANFGHITHLEGGASLFENLRTTEILKKEPHVFELAFFVHMCDVAGALGDQDPNSSLVYTENTHKSLMAVKNACYRIKDLDEKKTYAKFIDDLGAILGLDSESPLEQVIIRVAAMMRLSKNEEAKVLKKAFLNLPFEELSLIIEQLGFDADDPNIMLTYMPTVLINLLDNDQLGATRNERIEQTVQKGVLFISRILQTTKEEIRKKPALYKGRLLNFTQVAQMAKENPNLLPLKNPTLTKTGLIQLL